MKQKLQVFLFLFLWSAMVFAQNKKTVTGIVMDKNNQPLPAVGVALVGSTSGTTTDADGKFSISVPENAKLSLSYVGYQTRIITVGMNTTIKVRLVEDSKALEEVVVIGYGSQKRQNVTGAVVSVKADKLDKTTITSFQQALAGRAPGLLAIQSTGQPGADVSVQIRSNPSFANSGVLYILDGVPVNDFSGEPGAGNRYGGTGVQRSALNFINPNDIESIEVLKDASAASIYGARAGAGVIIVTTKKGKAGKPTIDYSFSHGFQDQAKFYEVFDQHDYMVQRNRIGYEAWLHQNNVAPYGNVNPSSLSPYIPKYTNQQIANAGAGESAVDAISRNGYTQQHNLSMSGMTGNTKYFASGNYLDQKGTLLNSDYKRYNGRINLEQTISKKLKAGLNVSASRSNADNPYVGTGQNENANMILAAIYQPPTLPLIDEKGDYTINPEYQNTANPLSFREIQDQTLSKRLLTNGSLEWAIIPDLTAKGNFSFDQSTANRSSYLPRTFLYGARAAGQASVSERTAETALSEYSLTYAKQFHDKHSLNGLVGYSYQVTNGSGINAGNNDFLTDNFSYNNLALGTGPKPTVGSYKYRERWASYFARAIYEYDQKYMITASVRRDGATKFAENHKYGIFPAVSAGWKISEEKFFNNVKAVNFLKFRVSYGTTGNSNIGGNANAYYSPGYNYTFGNVDQTGVALSQLNNDNLTWETVREINTGVDFGLLNDRITGSFDYFNKTISDLLSFRPLASDFPVSSVADNVGKTRSTGWELGLQAKIIACPRKNGFNWTTDVTFSHFYDKWVQRSPESLKILAKYIDPKGPFSGIYGYVSDGIYTPDKPAPAWMPNIIPGTVILEDLNGYDTNGNLTGKPDGKLSSADMVLLDINGPKYNFGINNTFRYANFDLNIYLYGLVGPKYNNDFQYASTVESHMMPFGWNKLTVAKNMWTHDNQSSTFPTGLNTGYESYMNSSDFWLEHANFIRCRNITLGYNLPSEMISKQKVFSGLRIYADVQNPFILTKYKGLDPELQDFLAYPNPRSFVLGLNVNF